MEEFPKVLYKDDELYNESYVVVQDEAEEKEQNKLGFGVKPKAAK